LSTFHLAIPAADLGLSKKFYMDLGAKLGREYPTNVILNFYGCQLVLHKSDKIDHDPDMYPRHFGIILPSSSAFMVVVNIHNEKPYVYAEMFTRALGEPSEHLSFFLKDPANNLIEFKWYKNPEAVFT
jgi:uncharacterized protein